ncbi:DUF2325 domain-containing protein [Haloimpatiens sp. FM7330]|uniref:DUF2325 domain-containing protein n=1 Tax=Haloimpatiens sp. FM7330 TaxID=3298610 RepID=UPI003637AECB
MSVLVIGGDKLGTIPNNLKKKGFDTIKHISGRRKKHRTFELPMNTDVVLVLTDYVGHQITKVIKRQCKKCSAKIVFSKRCWTCIEKDVEEILEHK